VTEGFGRIPLNRRAFEFLRGVEGRHVFLSPEHRELLVARHLDGEEDRRELIEAQPEEVSEAFAEVKKGMTVQVFAGDVFGQMGKVEKVEGDEVSVVLDTGDKIVVPERNVGIVR
jgi:transcription antitermination factor NusG